MTEAIEVAVSREVVEVSRNVVEVVELSFSREGTIKEISISMPEVVNTSKPIVLISSARYARLVKGIYGLKTEEGTVTVSIKKNGVGIAGLNAVAVTASKQDVMSTALNDIQIGDRVTIELSGAASAIGLEGTIKLMG